jgi:DNA helicase IV
LVLDEVIRASIHDAEATPEEIDETVEHRMLTWLPWVESLPPFDSLSNQPDQQWLIALMAWNLDLENETSIFQGIEHVIVDEAQDLYPVEWSFLRSINLTGSWTVVGDFNQQSAVHGFKSWKMIGKQLEVASPPQILDLGYRSTSGIMALANATIGSMASAGQSIQISSELPIAKRVPKVSELPLEIENWADRFAEKFPGGITALIVAPKHVDAVRKVLALRHWWAEGDQLHWRHPGREWTQENALTIGTPQELRGLEYDAVILLEPADIPTKQQRFMAITRANRELVVLHASKALPSEMHKFLRPPWE